jgi:hypothetical protein
LSLSTDFDLDDDGKIDLQAIYRQPDPRMYYQTLATLDYRIPAAAGPFLLRAIDAFREARRKETATVLDVGSSYGINAAILKHGYDLGDLYGLYGPAATNGVEPEALLDRDRGLFGHGHGDETLTTIGLDVAGDAIAYAREAGIIDRGITANLEERRATPDEAAELLPVDVVVSTGAVGYVGVPTFDRILDEARRKPWFAFFSLRMFPVDDIAAALRKRGYAIFKLDGETFRQRRFANGRERREVLARLAALDVDPAGREADGWLHAEFFLARPEGEVAEAAFPDLKPI